MANDDILFRQNEKAKLFLYKPIVAAKNVTTSWNTVSSNTL